MAACARPQRRIQMAAWGGGGDAGSGCSSSTATTGTACHGCRLNHSCNCAASMLPCGAYGECSRGRARCFATTPLPSWLQPARKQQSLVRLAWGRHQRCVHPATAMHAPGEILPAQRQQQLRGGGSRPPNAFTLHFHVLLHASANQPCNTSGAKIAHHAQKCCHASCRA